MIIETFVWWLFPQSFISFPDEFLSIVSSTTESYPCWDPCGISSTMDLLSVQQQILGNDSVASPAETLPVSSLTLVSPPSGRYFPMLRNLEEDVLFPSPAEQFVPSSAE